MLTYTLDREAGPLYEALYRGIRGDILEGRLTPGEKLPSKRALADHLKISKVTVGNGLRPSRRRRDTSAPREGGLLCGSSGSRGRLRPTGGLWSCRRPQGLSGRRSLRPTTCRRRPFPSPSGPSFSGRCFWTTERSFWGRCRQEAPMCSARPLRIICMDSAP